MLRLDLKVEVAEQIRFYSSSLSQICVTLVGYLELHSLLGVLEKGGGFVFFFSDLIWKEKGGRRAVVLTVQQSCGGLLCGSDCLQQGSKSWVKMGALNRFLGN